MRPQVEGGAARSASSRPEKQTSPADDRTAGRWDGPLRPLARGEVNRQQGGSSPDQLTHRELYVRYPSYSTGLLDVIPSELLVATSIWSPPVTRLA